MKFIGLFDPVPYLVGGRETLKGEAEEDLRGIQGRLTAVYAEEKRSLRKESLIKDHKNYHADEEAWMLRSESLLRTNS